MTTHTVRRMGASLSSPDLTSAPTRAQFGLYPQSDSQAVFKATNSRYAQAFEDVQRQKEAREEGGNVLMWGSIFLGPLIGTAIGNAIGGSANDSEDSADFKKRARKP